MSDLKNCPFCNGTHSINVINFFTGDSFRKCDICGAEAPEAKTPEEAAEKWNTRPAEDAKDKEIERLRAALLNIKNRLFERTYLGFGEAAVADWVVQKVNEALDKDTNVPANAPDTGKMEEK